MHSISAEFVWNHGRKLTQEILQRKGQTLAGIVLYRLIFRLERGGAKHPLIQTERRVEIENESRRGRLRLMRSRCVVRDIQHRRNKLRFSAGICSRWWPDTTQRGTERDSKFFVGKKSKGMITTLTPCFFFFCPPHLHSGALVLAMNEIRSFRLISLRLF